MKKQKNDELLSEGNESRMMKYVEGSEFPAKKTFDTSEPSYCLF